PWHRARERTAGTAWTAGTARTAGTAGTARTAGTAGTAGAAGPGTISVSRSSHPWGDRHAGAGRAENTRRGRTAVCAAAGPARGAGGTHSRATPPVASRADMATSPGRPHVTDG